MVNEVNENGSEECTIVGIIFSYHFLVHLVLTWHLSEGLTGANLSETPN